MKKSLFAAGLIIATLAVPSAWAAGPQQLAQATTAAAPTGGLMSGANSFTENEAKARIERAGYSNVGALKKDDQGIWRGTASKDGKTMSVGLDFKGNIAGM